jgi:hypothetical protein
MPGSELSDRIAAFLREQQGGADATTIAREFLRLTDPTGTASATLVRAILGRDARFVEKSGGVWQVGTLPGKALGAPVLLVGVEISAGAAREPWLWRVVASPWGGDGRGWAHRGAARSPELARMLRAMAEEPIATDRAGALVRWIGAQERLHAFPETEPLLIDLRGWGALLSAEAAQGKAPGAESGPEEDGEYLGTLALSLERVVEAAAARGLTTWEAVAAAPRQARERACAEIRDAPREITPEMLAALPEEPGTYRFLTRDRSVLYVGKAKNLRRRVGSYFRPLEAGGPRRDSLLREIQRLEIEPMGSELEALIREAQEIARSRPPWNVQVRLDPEPPEYPLGENDLLLVVPGASGTATLFLMAGPRVGLLRPAITPEATELAELLSGFYSDGGRPAGVEEIPAPERVLVRRWIGWDPGGIALLRLIDFATFRDLSLAAVRAASPAATEFPVRVRG